MATNKTYDETTFETTGQSFALGGSVTEKAGAIIYVSGANALTLADSPWKVKIDGTLQSTTSHGIHLAAVAGVSKAPNATVTVGTEGTVWGNGGGTVGIYAEQATDIVNSGVIHGGTYGIFENGATLSSTKAVSVTNNVSGVIVGKTYGIYVDDANRDLVVKNAGTIGDAMTLSSDFGIQFRHSLQLTNTGDIYGVVQTFDPTLTFASMITNSGLIGDYLDPFGAPAIELAEGNDTVTNSVTGIIEGAVNMHGGNNTLTNAGFILAGVIFGDGDDKMTNSGQALGDITMANGNNTFTNSGEAGKLTLGSGNDVVTNTKEMAHSIDLGEGNNKFTNSGTVAETVTFGDGDDTAANSKTIAGAVDLGDGKNSLSNSGTLESTLTFGAGDDIVKNTGTVAGAISFGNGNNSFTNSGDLQAGVAFGSGNDVLNNSSELKFGVSMGDGNNTVINTGVLSAAISFGAGNDVFKTTHSAYLTLDMGDGNDTFVGGSGRDEVNDNNGDDSYSLGGGDDTINYETGTDTIDGGTGNDTFSAFYGSSGSLFINVDSKAFTFNMVTVAANSLNTLGGLEVGKIKGFESVTGTNSVDWLHGSSAGEALRGAGGADIYIGGGGADTLNDYADGAIDTFIYQKITDSGATKATRDTILGFEGAGAGGGDTIDLSAIDANTKVAGNDTFDFIGSNNVAFHKVAGELRTVIEGSDTIIQGDVNGDGRADFTIAVTGIKTFVSTDFVL